MKKKFLLYVAVIVTCLFLGFTIYYIARNDENMYLNIDNTKAVYINVNETIEWPVVWTKPYKDTKLNVLVGDENILSYDNTTKVFTGKTGGYTNVTITSTNKHFGPFVFEVYVGDGSLTSPYLIKDAVTLAKIGNDVSYASNKSYALANDIDLKAYNSGKWVALPEFEGNFNGNGYTIYNLNLENSNNAGLFSSISSTGVVENVKFDRVEIDGEYDYLGVVAGINKGLVGKISVLGTINNTKVLSVTGAIVGENQYENAPAYINMCSAKVTIDGSGDVGGIAGLNYSSVILNCVAEITVSTQRGLNIGGIIGVNQSSYDLTNNLYYPSAIVKCYSVVNEINVNSSFIGAIVGNNIEEDNGNVLNKNVYEDIIYAVSDNLVIEAVGGGDDLGNNSTITPKTKNELLLQDTYVNFNFDGVWVLNENHYAQLNFLGNYETILIKGIVQEYNTTSLEFEEFLLTMKEHPENEVVYYVTEDTIVDLENEEWETIAKNISNPLKSSIVVEDGASLIIKNFKLSGDNTSFFGYISTNAIIDGVTFENVNVTSNGENVAVVSTSLLNGATLKNITVNNTSINTSAKNVAIICADNNGNIIGCSSANSNKITTMAESGIQKNVGGIVAYNKGTLTNNKVKALKVEINTVSATGNYNIGGTCGLTETSISSNEVDEFELESTNDGTNYIGGVVGYVLSKNASQIKVDRCYSKANINISVNCDETYVGGIVAYLGAQTTVLNCAFNGNIKANKVAGLVCINYGKLSTSYSKGTIQGVNVGGLTTNCFGEISNCYTLSSLVGHNNNSSISGITNLVGPDCLIDKCFSSATFSGEGRHYAESASEFRASWLSKLTVSFRGDVEFGTVSNLVVINYGKARVQSSLFTGRQGWIEANEEDCKGRGDFAVFKEQANFDSSIWNFQDGEYPTLKDQVNI